MSNSMIDQAFVVIKREDGIHILQCESITTEHHLSYIRGETVVCDCENVVSITDIPEDVQKKFMECIESQTIKEFKIEKQMLEEKIVKCKRQSESFEAAMRRSYKMLKEYYSYAKNVEDADANLFAAWLELKVFAKDHGITEEE